MFNQNLQERLWRVPQGLQKLVRVLNLAPRFESQSLKPVHQPHLLSFKRNTLDQLPCSTSREILCPTAWPFRPQPQMPLLHEDFCPPFYRPPLEKIDILARNEVCSKILKSFVKFGQLYAGHLQDSKWTCIMALNSWRWKPLVLFPGNSGILCFVGNVFYLSWGLRIAGQGRRLRLGIWQQIRQMLEGQSS